MKRVLIAVLCLAFACQKAEAPKPVAKKPIVKPPGEVGSFMPEYATTTLDGQSIDLAASRGSVVFLNVWATWCTPCRAEIPELKKLHAKYRDRGVKLVGISIEESSVDDVKSFVKEQKIDYPIAYDAEDKIANLLQTNVLPTSIVIDKTGKIVWKQIGALQSNEVPAVEAEIEKALR